MGKKEQVIKTLNKEYHNEVNAEEHDEMYYINMENIRYNEQQEEDKACEKFDTTVASIKEKLTEYIEYHGLPLCQKLNYSNLENYINYVVEKSS